jgi:hypothetical protein
LKILNRGLFALILTLLVTIPLVASEYLYKDEIVHNSKFTHEIETVGTLLYQKTGITLKLVMIKELPKNTTMYEYEKKILSQFQTPTVLLAFSEMNSVVDIEVNDDGLYKYFNKKQVLSPVTSTVQAVLMGLFYARSWDEFKSIVSNTGGTILPLLGGKAKKGKVAQKYSAAMFNGYLDIAQQIAKAKGVKLGEGYGSDTNQETLFYVRLLFYGVVLYAIIMYIKRLIYKRRHKDETFRKW